MPNSLLFIPDISGYTNFIQNTEIEHAEHVIAEILELLISSNTENLQLAEIEGDALFFYKEGESLSRDRLLKQVESMYTAFYSHLKMLEKNRICSCNACATAPQLKLKIIIHCGEIQFLKVQKSRKPFGNAVITAHRLLKNSVQDNNYTLLSKDLARELELNDSFQHPLFQFNALSDEYDGVKVDYLYASIDIKKLKLQPFSSSLTVTFDRSPDSVLEYKFACSAEQLLETITNYKYRHLWVKGAESFDYSENEVTRLGSEHICTVNGKQLNFVAVTKPVKENELVYGEMTSSPPPVDEVYNFFILTPIDEVNCRLRVEQFLKAKSPLKKLFILFFVKKLFRKGMTESLTHLQKLIEQNG